MEGLKIAHQKPLGLLMLQTQFERVLGDVGHPETFDFPVIQSVVTGATASAVVLSNPSALLPAFIQASLELVEKGAVGIGTSCGFLGQFQRELRDALPVPVATTALLQVPWIQALLPSDAQVGVITISAKTLPHIAGTPMVGLDEGDSQTLLDCLVLGNGKRLNPVVASSEVISAGQRLITEHPKVKAIVLECTNLPPYSQALKKALGLPVYDVTTMLRWFYAGL